MPEGKNHDIDRNHSKKWSKTSICEIGNYFWDNPIEKHNFIKIPRNMLEGGRRKTRNIVLQGEAHKVLQSDSTQTIDHIQKCFRQKFQCSRRPS